MDVACFAVQLLHQFVTDPGRSGDRYQIIDGFRRVVESKLGRRITGDIAPDAPAGQKLERELRCLIAEDAEFGRQMLAVVKDQYPFTADNAPLYYEDLLERDEAYTPFVWQRRHTVITAAILVVLLACLAGAVVLIF